jgi:hemerythrin-like domain-containing protein
MANKRKTSSHSRWSQEATQKSDALDLEEGVFTWKSPRKIAQSLKESADSSNRRKAEPFRSAMSMLVFYINRAGKNLDKEQAAILEQAKQELRVLYGKE